MRTCAAGLETLHSRPRRALWAVFLLVALLAPRIGDSVGYPLPEGVRRNIKIARGQFLIASRLLMKDPRFQQSVILLIHHDENGTIGLILNHPAKITVHQLLPDLTGPQQLADTVFIGGPVTPRQLFLLVKTKREIKGFEQIVDNVSFSADADAIKNLLVPKGQDETQESQPPATGDQMRERYRMYAGYSGWAPGQLDAEITTGGWNVLPADDKSVFDLAPADLWEELDRRTNLQQAVAGLPGK